MGRTWTVEVGHSTRALEPVDAEHAVTAALAAGGNIIELSALDEDDLDAALSGARGFACRNFRRVSVHAPIRHRRLPEPELVARLAAAGVPVVVPPGVISDPEPWQALGRHLLIENTADFGAGDRTAARLAAVFDILPDAGLCLDISHALESGGPDLVAELASTFANRLEEIHVGCECGDGPGDHLDATVLDMLYRVIARAGRPLPAVIQRPARTQSNAMAQVYAVRGALVSGVQTRSDAA
jgi:hypothetical protein